MGGILYATVVRSHLDANYSQAMMSLGLLVERHPQVKTNRRTLPSRLSSKKIVLKNQYKAQLLVDGSDQAIMM